TAGAAAGDKPEVGGGDRDPAGDHEGADLGRVGSARGGEVSDPADVPAFGRGWAGGGRGGVSRGLAAGGRAGAAAGGPIAVGRQAGSGSRHWADRARPAAAVAAGRRPAAERTLAGARRAS